MTPVSTIVDKPAEPHARPLVSVVIPVRNGALTLGETLKSVFQQSYEHLEIIVVDDHSTDTTTGLPCLSVDPRVRLLSLADRGIAKGVSAARNAGIEQSQGEFLAFLDADDLWMPNKIQRQLETLLANPNAGAVYSFVDRFSEHSGRRPETRRIVNGPMIDALLSENVLAHCSNVMARRAAIEATGNFNVELTHAEDWEFNVRLAATTNFVGIPEVLSLYRDNPVGASTQVDRMLTGYLRAQELLTSQLGERYSSEQRDVGRAGLYRYLLSIVLERIPGRRQTAFSLKLLLRGYVLGRRYPDVRHRFGFRSEDLVGLGRQILQRWLHPGASL